VRCFCFGHTETCYSSNLQMSQVTFQIQIQIKKHFIVQIKLQF
jgi:hypothetical protein